ncbi:MAG TPA: hypothetical protein VFU21_28745, partial [Kofleriaceae bacterium]|nr:hypothetical protein [Kofleriaceae bacterium]
EAAGKATEPGAAGTGGEAPVAAPTSAPTGTMPAGQKPAAAAALPADPGGKKAAHLWSRRMGGGEAESGRAIAVAPDGSVYVSGMFKDEASFGDAHVLTANGVDGFLARLDPTGKTLWARGMGGEGDDVADAVAIDPHGNAVVAGSFSSKLTLGDSTMESKGSDDMFVAALDKDGRRLWARRFGGPDSDGLDGIAVDRAGNIAVIGSYHSEMEVAKDDLFSGGDLDIALIMLAPDGTPKWGRGWGAMGPDEGRAVAFDKDGNLYVLVEFSRVVDFGGGKLQSGGNRDIGVIKLDPSGKHVWSRRFGGQLDELAVSLAVDDAGNAVLTGSFDDVLDFGDGAPLHTAGRSDVFVAKLGPDGATLWAQKLGNTDEDIGAAVAVDAYGNVYAAGWFWKSLEVAGVPHKSKGKKDMFLAAFGPAGAPLWGRTFGDSEDDYGRGLAASGGAIYATGTFHKTMNLGGEDLTAAVSKTPKIPYGDVFVAKWER